MNKKYDFEMSAKEKREWTKVCNKIKNNKKGIDPANIELVCASGNRGKDLNALKAEYEAVRKQLLPYKDKLENVPIVDNANL